MLNKTAYNKDTDRFSFEHTKELIDIHGNTVTVVDFVREKTLEEIDLEIAGHEKVKADIEKTISRLQSEKAAAEQIKNA